MLLSEKGYHVNVFDRLQTVGGRGSSKTQEGHRFDLGPTILTLPKNFEELWKRCGDDLNKHVKIEKLNPYYDLIFEDNDVLLHFLVLLLLLLDILVCSTYQSLEKY